MCGPGFGAGGFRHGSGMTRVFLSRSRTSYHEPSLIAGVNLDQRATVRLQWRRRDESLLVSLCKRQHRAWKAFLMSAEHKTPGSDAVDVPPGGAERTQDIQLLARAISHLGEGVLITDGDLNWPDPKILFANEAICRISGYAIDELIGHTPRILEGEGTDQQSFHLAKAKLFAGNSCSVEFTCFRKNGISYDAEVLITPLLDCEGRRTNFVSIHRDLTDRKRIERDLMKSEEGLQAIHRAAVDAIITINRRGVIVRINPAAEQMFGYAEEEMLGQNVAMLMPSPYRDEHDVYIQRYLRTGKARIIGTGREAVGCRKDGSRFPIGLAVSEVDHLGLFTGIIRDITEIKNLEKEILRTTAEQQRAIGQDLHDGVGQELTGLAFLARTLEESLEQDAPQNAQMAEKIVAGLRRAHSQVRAISRGLIPVEVDSEGLAAALSDLAADTARNADVDCSFAGDDAVRIGDNHLATHFYRIAQEAIANALRHGRASRVEVSLTREHDVIAMQVRDDGIGFCENNVNEDGMGLRIMQHRAHLMGATLSVERRAEGGTVIRCDLPAGPSS